MTTTSRTLKKAVVRKLLLPVALSAPLLLASCGSLRDTLRLEGRTFVKVPPHIPVRDSKASNGWHFKYVMEAPMKSKFDAGHWYMAWHDDERDRTGSILFSKRAWKKARAQTPEIVMAAKDALGVWPVAIEPNPVFREPKIKKLPPSLPPQKSVAEAPGSAATVKGLKDAGWATGQSADGQIQPGWHLGDDYSQLASARNTLRSNPKDGSAGGGIKVAILDNGFDDRVAALPKNLRHSPDFDAIGYLQSTKEDKRRWPGSLHSGHGTATLSVLAGGTVTIKGVKKVADWTGELGGAPDATVYPMRVAPWVASPSTANMAYAIDQASRVQGCDIISMSHGGSPSRMWVDAVNAAYDRGTAIFAATADYVNLPFFNAGIIAPSATVYPAAFRRAVAVGGVAANRASYGKADFSSWTLGSVLKSPLDSLFHMRASYGPDGTAWMWNHEKRMKLADSAQRKDFGILHAHPVSGWAPNITASLPAKKDGSQRQAVKLDFGGASAATPQAAAAAVLWLARHRKEIEAAGQWNSWQKAEAAYQALLYSAERSWPENAGLRKEDQQPRLFYGAGYLRASDALAVSFAKARSLKGKTLKWPRGTPPQEFFDGDRSYYRILKLRSSETAAYGNRLYPLPDKKTLAKPATSAAEAINIVHHNMILAELWREGALPVTKIEPSLKQTFMEVLTGRVQRDRSWVEAQATKRTQESLTKLGH